MSISDGQSYSLSLQGDSKVISFSSFLILQFKDLETMHITENEKMTVGVVFQVVDLRLLIVAEITYAEHVVLDGEIETQHLP
jgi:hypothetical protein